MTLTTNTLFYARFVIIENKQRKRDDNKYSLQENGDISTTAMEGIALGAQKRLRVNIQEGQPPL